MYELRPIITLSDEIELPTCMYSIGNIHGGPQKVKDSPSNFDTFVQVERFLKHHNAREMAEVEGRQQKLLNQLEELKTLMQSIKLNLRQSNKETPKNVSNVKVSPSAAKTSKSVSCSELVIKVNPLYPPYYLLFLQRSLSNKFSIKIKSYLHSTLSNLPPKTEQFLKSLLQFQSNGTTSVTISLIWKRIDVTTELSVCHYPIIGESNVLRYIARVLENELNYENCRDVQKIDGLLDSAHNFVCCSMKCKNDILQHFNKSLGKTNWLCGEKDVTIADIAVYDCLKKHAKPSDIDGQLSKWFNHCEQYLK